MRQLKGDKGGKRRFAWRITSRGTNKTPRVVIGRYKSKAKTLQGMPQGYGRKNGKKKGEKSRVREKES